MNGERTHEPNLRELTAELDGLKELLLAEVRNVRELMTERDRSYRDRYEAQDKAVIAALVSAKELTTAAFSASEKAIVKAEEAQKSYNQTHNDLLRKMEVMMPRSECEKSFSEHNTRLTEAKEEIAKNRDELQKIIFQNRDEASKLISNSRDEMSLEIRGLRESRSEVTGRSGGVAVGWGIVVGAATVGGGIVAIIALVMKLGG